MSDQTSLSERELEVLRLVAAGASNNEIAQELIISPNTVKVHIRNIYSKLGVLSRTEASMEGLRRGLISVPGANNGTVGVADEPINATDGASPDRVDVPVVVPALVDVPLEPSNVATEVKPRDPPVASAVLFAPAEPARALGNLPPPSALSPDRPTVTHVAIPRRIAMLIAALLIVVVIAVGVIGWIVARSGTPISPPLIAATSLPRVENVWKPLTALPQPVQDAAGVYFDEAIYIVGGTGPEGTSKTMRRLDLTSGQWQMRASKPSPVAAVSATVIGRQIYVPGGIDPNGVPSTTFDIYDIAADRWSSGPALPVARADYALAAIEGKLYVFGGRDASGPVSTTLIFNPENNQWSNGLALPLPLSDAAIAQDGQQEVFIVGGTTSNNRASLATLHYDLQTWETLADLPEARIDGAAAFITDRLYMIGGADTDRPILMLQGNSWREEDLQTGYPLSRQVVVLRQRTIYAVGGRNATTTLAEVRAWTPTVEIFLPGVQR